jgi:hypothetical protein
MISRSAAIFDESFEALLEMDISVRIAQNRTPLNSRESQKGLNRQI